MKFTDSHEWIKTSDSYGFVGITNFAKNELGTIVYVELPKIGQKVKAGEEIAVLESTKAAADIYSPVSGIIIEINEDLKNQIQILNQDPENRGWLFKIELSNPVELEALMDKTTYFQQIVCSS